MTRQIVITQNITLDGVVEATDGWFDPGDEADDGGMLEALQTQMQEEVGFLVGRTTFEEMRGFWPAQTDDTTGITAHLNAVDKYVVSTTMTDPGWENSTVLSGGEAFPEQITGLLKEGPDGDVGVTGSIDVCHALLRGGLVDELRLFVYPVVLGRGRRLFPEGVGLRGLTLTGSRSFPTGVTLQTYRVR